MTQDQQTTDFWQAYLSLSGKPATTRPREIFYFDDNQTGADQLAALVLAGPKRATARLLWEYEALDLPIPKPGDLRVVTDWSGMPQCVIETRSCDTVPYDQVTEAFSATEGEGDLSLAHWREVHWPYFCRVCERIGKTPAQDMPILCHSFSVVFAGK